MVYFKLVFVKNIFCDKNYNMSYIVKKVCPHEEDHVVEKEQDKDP